MSEFNLCNFKVHLEDGIDDCLTGKLSFSNEDEYWEFFDELESSVAYAVQRRGEGYFGKLILHCLY